MIMGKGIYALGSRTNWYIFTQQRRCAECKKKFSCTPNHVYKNGDDLYCSWTCYRVRQKAEEARIAEMERKAEEDAAKRAAQKEARRAEVKSAKEAEKARVSLDERIIEAADRVKECMHNARIHEKAYAQAKTQTDRRKARELARYWRKRQESAEHEMYRLMEEDDA